LFNPYFGVLLWTWIAICSPHRFTYGLAYSFPVAQVIAIPTLLGTVFTRHRNHKWLVRETALLFLLWMWFVFTTIYATQHSALAAHTSEAVFQLGRICKILVMAVVTILLVTSKRRFRYLVLVTAVSIGVLALKGAIFGVRTGGQSRIWGPPDSFLADNNDFGLALNMCLPMFFYLAQSEPGRLLRRTWYVFFYSGILCSVLTYSRGALLGLVAVLGALALKSKHKVLSVVFLMFLVVMVVSFAPPEWMNRMDTFLHGKIDTSAQERLISWSVALNLTKDYPVTGGGFGVFTDEGLYQRYQSEPLPNGHKSSGPHSIYFQVLGEQGYLGLILFLLLVASSWVSLRALRRRVRTMPNAQWIAPYSRMIEVSLVAYMISGAFLGRAYFDLFYLLISLTILLKVLIKREVSAAQTLSKSAPAVAEPEESVSLSPA
jgi:probable O-glycosylation ligase (exosortase A-associated)